MGISPTVFSHQKNGILFYSLKTRIRIAELLFAGQPCHFSPPGPTPPVLVCYCRCRSKGPTCYLVELNWTCWTHWIAYPPPPRKKMAWTMGAACGVWSPKLEGRHVSQQWLTFRSRHSFPSREACDTHAAQTWAASRAMESTSTRHPSGRGAHKHDAGSIAH